MGERVLEVAEAFVYQDGYRSGEAVAAFSAGRARAYRWSIVVWTTTEVLLNEHGPLAPIWMQQIPPRVQGGEWSRTPRQSLFNSVPGNKGAGGERDRTPSLERP